MTNMEKADLMLKQARDAVDRGDIENLFGRYQYLHSLGKDYELPALFSQKLADVHIDIGQGVIEGMDDLTAFYKSRRVYRGEMLGRTLLNPMIEIAGDGQTAKGLWVAAGHDTYVFYDKPDPREFPLAYRLKEDPDHHLFKLTEWVWYKYGVDFVREDGQWRIWHIFRLEVMRCPYDEDWIDFSISRQYPDTMQRFNEPWQGLSPEDANQLNFVPTRPSPEPWKGYTLAESTPAYPRMPEPYQTFSDTFAY